MVQLFFTFITILIANPTNSSKLSASYSYDLNLLESASGTFVVANSVHPSSSNGRVESDFNNLKYVLISPSAIPAGLNPSKITLSCDAGFSNCTNLVQ